MSKIVKGIGVGKRTVLGRVYRHVHIVVDVQKNTISDLSAELVRLSQAVDHSRSTLADIAEQLKKTDENSADILFAQLEFLEDPEYIGAIEQKIEIESINAEAAVDEICNSLVQSFMEVEDPYFRERASDIKDMSARLIASLSDNKLSSLDKINQPSIIVAESLFPSDTAQINPEYVLGFCTEKGTATSHTAILANSFGIPAVVGCGKLDVKTGDIIILDGATGMILLNPSQEEIANTKKQIEEQGGHERELITKAQSQAITRDGIQCSVYANIASNAEAKKALDYGAEGVGLLRTEFFFYQEDSIPSEERQFEIYAAVAATLETRSITIRTLDIGGDKPLKSLQEDYANEQNPFLGVRGMRLTDMEPELLSSQLLAILRVSVECNAKIKVMFPFVSSVGEVKRMRAMLEACQEKISAKGLCVTNKIKFGVMIEIPSAALVIDNIFKYSDFVSIGTNDLTQYTCAVDRTNERVNMLADYCHPGVLRLVNMVLESGIRNNKEVSICGEMAGDPLVMPLLYGMGLSVYSMSAVRIPSAKELLRSLRKSECMELVHICLRAETASEVRGYLQDFASS